MILPGGDTSGRNAGPGVFVTLEGGDGAGKSTHAAAIEAWASALGLEVVRTREPGGTEVGVRIRELVLHHRGHVDPRAEALLYAADRAQHIDEVVRPALARGAVVVQDRYLDSSIAYQGAGRDLGDEEVRALSLWATRGLLPDATILLDLSVDEAAVRLRGAAKGFDRLEQEHAEFHERVRARFLALASAEPKRFEVVDASRSFEEVATQIRTRLEPLIVPLTRRGAAKV